MTTNYAKITRSDLSFAAALTTGDQWYNPQNGISIHKTVGSDEYKFYIWSCCFTASTQFQINRYFKLNNEYYEDGFSLGETCTQVPIFCVDSSQNLYAVWVNGVTVKTATIDYLNNDYDSFCSNYTAANNVRLVSCFYYNGALHIMALVIGASTTYLHCLKSSAGSLSSIGNIQVDHASMTYSTVTAGYVTSLGYYAMLYTNTSNTTRLLSLELSSGIFTDQGAWGESTHWLNKAQYHPHRVLTDSTFENGRSVWVDYNVSETQYEYYYLYPLRGTFPVKMISVANICTQISDQSPYTLCVDLTNKQLGLTDPYTPNYYPIYSDSNLTTSPIAICDELYIDSSGVYLLTIEEMPVSSCVINKKDMRIVLYDDIGLFNNMCIFIYNDSTLACRFHVISYSSSSLVYNVDGENLSGCFTSEVTTVGNTTLTADYIIQYALMSSPWLGLGTIDDSDSTVYPTIVGPGTSLNTVITLLETITGGKVSVTPEGLLSFEISSITSTGVTLSEANDNILPFSEIDYVSHFGRIVVQGGYYDGKQLISVKESTKYSGSPDYVYTFPNIIEQTFLYNMAIKINTIQETNTKKLICTYFGTSFLQYGYSVSLDLTDYVDLYPELGSGVVTMYIDSLEYDTITQSGRMVLYTAFKFIREELSSSYVSQSIDSLATDAQTNGNIHQPYCKFRREADHTFTSGVVYEVVPDNKDEATGFTWTSGSSNIYVDKAGIYMFSLYGRYSTNSTGTRLIELRINNTPALTFFQQRALPNPAGITQVSTSGIVRLNAGDYFRVRVNADFTGTAVLLEQCFITVARIGI